MNMTKEEAIEILIANTMCDVEEDYDCHDCPVFKRAGGIIGFNNEKCHEFFDKDKVRQAINILTKGS